jgi:tetratricopeptide (TPR) repeat protein
MGNLELASNNYDESIDYLNKAIAIRIDKGDVAGTLLANSYLCLARAYLYKKDYEKAFTILGQSEALFFRTGGPDTHFMAQ